MTDTDTHPPADSVTNDETPPTPDYLLSPNAVLADKDVTWRFDGPPDYSNTRHVWENGT